jgi:hypothetical protein
MGINIHVVPLPNFGGYREESGAAPAWNDGSHDGCLDR